MHVGQTYKVVTVAVQYPMERMTFVGIGEHDEACPFGFWEFDVPDNDTEGADTHRVFVNPANVLSVLP